MGDEEQLNTFAFHVRGGDLAAFAMADILRHLRLRALENGIFELHGDPTAGLRRWRQYRDRLLRTDK
jgi:hypothetical protein